MTLKAAFYKERINDLCKRNGVLPIPDRNSEDIDKPDNPPCDCCGELWTGINTCSVCQSAFYCSKECQRTAWKQGHKHECKQLQAKARSTAKKVVNDMLDTSLESLERVKQLDDLSRTAIYKAALEYDLHAAIQKLMKNDKDFFVERVREGLADDDVCYTTFMMSALFRGNRREGYGISGEEDMVVYDSVDGNRIKSYIMSSPDAFEDWFQASMEVLACFTLRDAVNDEKLRADLIRTSMELIRLWTVTVANKKVAKAIFLGHSMKSDKVAIQRAKFISKQIKRVLTRLYNAPKGIDIGQQIENFVYILAAEIAAQLKTYNIPVDITKILGLRGQSKWKYLDVAVPFADEMLR